MPLPNEVLDFLRSLREPIIDNSTLSDENRAMIAKKFREFNQNGISYSLEEMDHWVEMAKPGWSYMVYTYVMYAAEVMKYGFQK